MTDLVKCYVEMDSLAYEMMRMEAAGKNDLGLCKKYAIAVDMFVATARSYYGDYDKGIDEIITQFGQDEAVQDELQRYLATVNLQNKVVK